MRLLVTGARGMLGQRLVAEAERRGHDVTAWDVDELDLTDAAAVAERVPGLGTVVNCAAYTDVDGAEADEATAARVNGDAAAHLAGAADRLVHLSTDYVFAGDREAAYAEDDEPAPRTAYGRTKLAGERAVLAAAGGRHAVVRTAWLYGAGGTNFVDTMLGLARDRDTVRVVADQVGCPTWTGHLAPAVLDVAETGGAGVFHAAGDGRCTWADLAEEAFAVAGVACAVERVTTAEFPRPAPRPPFSVLASTRVDGPQLPPWRDGVRGHLA